MLIGFLLDAILGDPQNAPHPVRAIGSLINKLDNSLNVATDSKVVNRLKGIFTLVVVWLCTVVAVVVVRNLPGLVLAVLHRQGLVSNASMIGAVLLTVIDGVLFYYGIAAKDLRVEAMAVGKALENAAENAAENATEDAIENATKEGNCDLSLARKKLSYIVGRDTDSLDKDAIIRACVETVAENTGDGVVGPIFFYALFGPVGLWIYKATSTMDSMIGYRNEKYGYFGTAGARMDDLFNLIPARLTSWLFLLVAAACKKPLSETVPVYNKYKKMSPSPNSGHPEAAMAAVLGVKLLGPCSYKGVLHDKPFIGEDREKIEIGHIALSCRYMYCAAVITLMLGIVANILFLHCRILVNISL